MPPRKPVTPSAQVVYIQTAAGDNSPRSKAQKEFNRLSKRIAKLEKDVATFREAATALRQRVQQEYRPLQAEHNRLRAGLVHLLDAAFTHQKLTKTERTKITYLIGEACYDLPQKGHPELQPLIDKYAPPPTAEEAQAVDEELAEVMKSFFSAQFGIEFDEEADVSTPEKMQAYAQQKLAEQLAAEEQEREERRAKRKKNPKQQAAEEKKQAEQTNITKAVRTLYLDLVKHLHPDLETEEAEKARKTELLQRVTTAYEAGELLTLLRLQLELNRIDQAQLESLADDQLRYYNRLLKEQAQELDYVLYDEQQQLAAFTGMPAYYTSTPAAMEYDYQRQKKQLEAKIAKMTTDLHEYEQAPAALKAFLKEFKIPKAGPGPLLVQL